MGLPPHTLLGALPQTLAGNFVPCTLSSLRGGLNTLFGVQAYAVLRKTRFNRRMLRILL